MHRYSCSYSEKNIVFVSFCLLFLSLLSQSTTTTTNIVPVATAFVPTLPLPQSTPVSSSHNHVQDSSIIHDKRNVLSVLKSTPSEDNDRKPTPSAPVSSTSTSTSKPLKTGDFEYQELKIQLKAMKDQDVTSSRLDLPKKIELDGYVKRVVNRRPSPIAMQDVGQHLPGTSWRLAFSTESFLTQTLPKDSTITLNFYDDGNNSQKVDYAIEFPKTLALKRLVAKSSYTASTSPVDAGLVQINYDSISTDIFGFQNIGVGMFGMLQGRSTFIPTVYFDGDIWIERGVDPTTGNEFFNVYSSD
mmetsp:Transcript_10495/g.25033  ORF Transcript_10495/g.25033 Transcript_10495/m.25033 type:complete len:301 (-) Transcript_10495:1559-2461(-)